MTKYAYSPDTGELIRTDTPSDWMGLTDVAPPAFDPATAGCFWRGNAWEIVVPAIDIEKIKADLSSAVQFHLDSAARQRGYDSILSASTYADDPSVPKFQAEGQAYRAWRALVWTYCYQVMADVDAGLRAIPAEADLIAELPALALP